MATILDSIEEIYRNNRRNGTSTTQIPCHEISTLTYLCRRHININDFDNLRDIVSLITPRFLRGIIRRIRI